MSGKELCAAPVELTIDLVTAEIKTHTSKLRRLGQLMIGEIIEIGRWLTEAKAMLPHGQWGDYLKFEVEYSQSTANSYMKIFEEYGAAQQSLFGGETDSQALGNLTYTKALQLLALPAEDREEFVASHDVDAMSTRELAAAVKERDEARKAAETAQAERKAAEEARAKMEADMKAANDLLESARAESAAASERESELRAELEELRARPIDVAVEEKHAAPEELEKARQEAVAQMQKRLDQAEAKRAKADKARKSAEEQAEALQKSLEQSAAKLEAMEREAHKANAAADPEIAAFRAHFDTWQSAGRKMMRSLDRIQEANGETANKLRGAIHAVVDRLESGEVEL